MGFDNECILNIQSLAGEYFCPVCRLLVYPNEALQSQCTHLYCKPCLTYVVSTTRACPYDGYLVTEADAKPLVESNKALADTIGKIAVHCLYHRSGCTWQGPLSDCTSHCSSCAFGNSPVVCNRCGIQIVHHQVQDHAQICSGVQAPMTWYQSQPQVQPQMQAPMAAQTQNQTSVGQLQPAVAPHSQIQAQTYPSAPVLAQLPSQAFFQAQMPQYQQPQAQQLTLSQPQQNPQYHPSQPMNATVQSQTQLPSSNSSTGHHLFPQSHLHQPDIQRELGKTTIGGKGCQRLT